MTVQINDNCTGCGACVAACPDAALSLECEGDNGFGRKQAVVDTILCRDCGDCLAHCRYRALSLPVSTTKNSPRQE